MNGLSCLSLGAATTHGAYLLKDATKGLTKHAY